MDRVLNQARQALESADALLIGAGAGFGVDSGLPDFRGPEGFWKAYPPYRNLGLGFSDLANPRFFKTDPAVAWGFYGHRQSLYRDINPHAGFDMLREYGETLPYGTFVYTSNVDGQFAKSGFPDSNIMECHGTIHHLQCSIPCTNEIWPASYSPEVNMNTMRADGHLPRCPFCGAVARPNILMFSDLAWIEDRTNEQQKNFYEWLYLLKKNKAKLVILEFGAGTAIPSVRYKSESLQNNLNATLIRVNPREPEGPRGTLSLPMKSLEACELLFAV